LVTIGPSTGASGAVLSVKLSGDAGPVLPSRSVAAALTSPLGCGRAEVTEKAPAASATVVPVEPSGKVTVTVQPGSAVPQTVTEPSSSVTSGSSSGASGGV